MENADLTLTAAEPLRRTLEICALYAIQRIHAERIVCITEEAKVPRSGTLGSALTRYGSSTTALIAQLFDRQKQVTVALLELGSAFLRMQWWLDLLDGCTTL